MSTQLSKFWIQALSLFAVLLFSYSLSRFDTLTHLNLSLDEAMQSGLVWGLYYDAVMSLFALVVTLVLGRVHAFLGAIGGGVWIAFTWCASLANLLHIRFFEAPLNWWVLEEHFSDLFVVQDSAKSFALHGAVWLSLLGVLASIVINTKLSYRLKQCAKPMALTAVMLVVLLVSWRGPAWLNISENGALLGDHIVRAWLLQNTRTKLFQGASSDWLKEIQKRDERSEEGGWLSAYRDGKTSRTSGDSSLSVELPPSNDRALKEARAQFGLPTDGAIHVVYLFLESVRAYELEHPEIGPEIFPRIRGHIAERGLHFEQAYSSSFEAGQTVRGQFSSFCSMLPNIGGAATYIAHTTLSIFCIQDYLRENGYRQGWFNSHHSGYHNKRLFERRHGTTEFYDKDYFESLGISETIGSWGLADGPFLKASLEVLKQMSQNDSPVFANVLTINTHHPQTVVAEGEVSPTLIERLGADEAYHGLLSRYRYTDEAVGDFLDALFASRLGARTLLVMVGDHGTRHQPPVVSDPIQAYEARFRVPLVFMSKDTEPRRFGFPVHQIDIAPTVAGVLGSGAQTTWLGRNILSGVTGSRWLYQENGLTSYRTNDRGCYPNSSFSALQCVDTRYGDPMFETLPRLEENPPETAFFEEVVRELVYVIAMDQIMERSDAKITDK